MDSLFRLQGLMTREGSSARKDAMRGVGFEPTMSFLTRVTVERRKPLGYPLL